MTFTGSARGCGLTAARSTALRRSLRTAARLVREQVPVEFT